MTILTTTSKFFDLADIRDLQVECTAAFWTARREMDIEDDAEFDQYLSAWFEMKTDVLRGEGYSAEVARQALILAWQLAYEQDL